MKSGEVILKKEESIYQLIINRPKQLNSLNKNLINELNKVFNEIKDKNNIEALIITGSGDKAFIAGADISEMVNFTPEEARKFSREGQILFKKIKNLSFPVIAAINGYALGGGLELALACDIRLANQEAIFGLPETSLGIIPGFGGTKSLVDIVGIAKAKELIFTAKKIKSLEAKNIGLINELVEGELMERSFEIANTIIENSSYAVSSAKELVDNEIQMSMEEANFYEASKFGLTFSNEDQKRRMEDFLSN